jgi:SAM-dependent methyltransferase
MASKNLGSSVRRAARSVRRWTRQAVYALVGNTATDVPRHIDPADGELAPFFFPTVGDPIEWARNLELFRNALCLPERANVRDGVLTDLADFFGCDREECVQRARGSLTESLVEWEAADRSTVEGVHGFFRVVVSWCFTLAWYAYLQAEGYAYPASPAALSFLADDQRARQLGKRRHLDFGSGIGATAQVFAASGFDTTLADVSESLLEFARFRLERRDITAGYLDLNTTELEPEGYDVITALDVFAHVPDVDETIAKLHRALRSGGWLFATFDARPKTRESGWHLHDEEWDLCWRAERSGFVQRGRLGQIRAYQRVELATWESRLARARAAAIHRNPALLSFRRAARAAALRSRSTPTAALSASLDHQSEGVPERP